ncbi:MAG: hypothetical protein QG635_852 [Bacteroidota bacterium]|nr:hypothetical protein [Bacteroidota bacterium]
MKRFTSFFLLLAAITAMYLSTSAQPINSSEQSEGLSQLIGRYETASSYFGKDTGWVNDIRREVTYTATGRYNECVQKSSDIQGWLNAMRHKYSYNAEDLQTELLVSIWASDDWVNWNKTSNTFDAAGNPIEAITQNWQANDWVNKSKTNMEYDSEGRITTYLNYNWMSDLWIGNQKTNYQYDEMGNTFMIENYRYQAGDWVQLNRETREYLDTGIIKTRLVQSYASGSFTNTSIDSAIYDTDMFLIENVTSAWSNGAWVLNSRQLYMRNPDSTISEYKSQIWNAANSEWVDNVKAQFIYTDNNKTIERTITTFTGDNWQNSTRTIQKQNSNNNLIDFRKFKWQNSAWVRDVGMSYDYGVAGVEEALAAGSAGLYCYPSPISKNGEVGFNLNKSSFVTLRLLDINGNVVKTIANGLMPEGFQNFSFDAAGLASGVYLLSLQTGTNEEAIQVIISK